MARKKGTSARAKSSGRKNEPQYKFRERVAALIERSLDPSATVEVNQYLLDRTTGERCQCDVVVHTGPPGRRTRTIVEVQKRRKKVDVNDFRGWLLKMQNVGAQHLVCVSAKGFPESVIKLAALRGPTVRLATLQELEQSTWEAVGITGYRVGYSVLGEISEVEFFTRDPGRVGPSGTIKFEEKVLRTKEGEVLSIQDVAKRLLMLEHERAFAPGTRKVRLETGDALEFLGDPSRPSVRIKMVVEVEERSGTMDMSFVDYQQVGDAEARTWVMTARPRDPVDGTEHEVQVTFRPGTDGRFVPHLVKMDGLDGGDTASLRLGRARARFIGSSSK